MSEHPSPELLLAFRARKLDAAQSAVIARHLAGCETCRAATRSTPSGRGAPVELPEQFGRYRIVQRLGRGGMGSVFLAEDTQLGRRVALKVPHFSADDDPRALERFYREARAAAALAHANLCPVYDVGQIDGTPYLTMAYVEGRPLADFIRPDRPLPPRQAAALARKLALALQEAHEHGVVHRDLKPANVMINRKKEPVVMDFGLARLGRKEESRLTQAGAVLGTPTYMAPEQVAGDVAAMGPGCDVYSLGVILYEMLTGRAPFEGPPTAVLGQILVAEPPPPSQHCPDLDSRLEAICLKAIAKKLPDRYASMSDLAAALTDYLRGETSAPPSATASSAPETRDDFASLLTEPRATLPGSRRPSPQDKTRRRDRRLPWMWIVAGGVAGLGLLVGILLLVIPAEGTIQIELTGQADGAEVRVDGDPVLPTDLRIPLRLRTGKHHLLVTGKDFDPVSEAFTVRRGKNPAFRLELRPRGGGSGDVAAVKSAPEPPGLDDPGVPLAWPANALREGRLQAPDLGGLAALFQDLFDDGSSGFDSGRFEAYEYGYRAGRYFVHLGPTFRGGKGSFIDANDKLKPVSNFACEVVGRLAYSRAGSWGLFLCKDAFMGEPGTRIAVSAEGTVRIVPWLLDPARSSHAPVGPLRHRVIKEGNDWNTLLVVVRGRWLEVYVNGVAVCDPLLLEREVSPSVLGLAATNDGQGADVEFARLTVWSAEGLPSLRRRGAVPVKAGVQ